MADVKLGEKPARQDSRTIAYSTYRTALASPPPQADWGHGLQFAMLGNSQHGDCVEAGYAHMVQIWGDQAGNAFVPTDAETLGAYTAITGFNPNDASTDQGTDILTAIGYWKSTGLGGQKITAYASVPPLDQAQVSEAIAWYGGAYVGVQLPKSSQSQVGSQWSVTTGPDAVAGSWGGHCVPLCGYDQNQLWCVTWGAFSP